MTVSSAINKHIYQGNGVNRIWPYSFKLEDSEHLHVFLSGPDRFPEEITAGFLIDTGNRTVTYPVEEDNPAAELPVLEEGEFIILLRKVPYLQPLDLENQGAFHAERIENEFDLLVMMIQQIAERAERAVTVPLDDSYTPDELAEQIIEMHHKYPEVLAAHAETLHARDLTTAARAQTNEYKDIALAAASSANTAKEDAIEAKDLTLEASQVTAWNSGTTYSFPDLVARPDGHTYRCLGEGVTGLPVPESSAQWACITTFVSMDVENAWIDGLGFGDVNPSDSFGDGGTF